MKSLMDYRVWPTIVAIVLGAAFAPPVTSQAQDETTQKGASQDDPSQRFNDALKKTCSSEPMEWIVEQNRFLIRGKINDKDAVFKIDTGAISTVLTLQSAKDRQLRIIDFKATFSGAGGTGKIYGSPVQRLQLGSSVDLTRQRLAVIDLPVLQDIDGLVGGDILASTKAIIDYRQDQLHIPVKDSTIDLSAMATESGLNSVKLEREGNYVFIILTRGDETLRLLIDTGAQRTILSSKAGNRLKLAVEETQERVVGAGDHATKVLSTKVDNLSAGSTTFRDLDCLVAPLDYLSSYSKSQIDGIFGADLMEASDAVLSVADAVIVLSSHDSR